MCMQIFQNLKILPCETSLVLLFCTVCHTSLRKQLFRTTWASGPPLCSNPSMAHDLSLVLFSALLQTLMRGVDVPQLTVISICDVSSLISDLCDQPGRIELIHGSPKITEHLCAKDWTALTDPLIWLRHRLLFPWHPRSLASSGHAFSYLQTSYLKTTSFTFPSRLQVLAELLAQARPPWIHSRNGIQGWFLDLPRWPLQRPPRRTRQPLSLPPQDS